MDVRSYKDRIRNERIKRDTLILGEISKKDQETMLKWIGHVMRREEHSVERRNMEMEVQWRRKIGRPNRRWLNRVGVISKWRDCRGRTCRPLQPIYIEGYVLHHRPYVKV